MLKKLFGLGRTRGPAAVALDHSATSDARLAALTQLQPEREADAAALATLVMESSAPALRRAAITRCAAPDLLQQLLADVDLDHTSAAAAAGRLVQLWSPAELPQHFAEQPRLALAALTSAELPGDVHEQAFSALSGDPAECANLAASDVAPQWRQRAVDCLCDDASLTQVVRATRNRDKRTHRLARERLDSLRGYQQRDAELARELDEIATRLRALTSRSADSLTRREAHHLQERWAAVAAEHAENRHAGAAFSWQPTALDASQARFAEASAQLAAAEAQEAEAAAAAAEAELSVSSTDQADPADPAQPAADAVPAQPADAESLQAAARSLASLRRSLQEGQFDPVRDMAALNTALGLERSRFDGARGADDNRYSDVIEAFLRDATLVGSVVEAAARLRALPELPPVEALPEPAADGPIQPARYAELWRRRAASRQARRGLESQLAGINWPAAVPAPVALRACRDHLHAMLAFEAACDSQAQHLAGLLDTLQDETTAQVDAGELAAALDSRSRGRELLRALPRAVQADRQTEFDLLAARVEELRDWREFATHPKREQLCAAMEARAESVLDPAEQAAEVRNLRSAWNALGTPRNAEDHKLKTRFDAAAERAFEPCRAWFEREAEQREANGAARIQVVEHLETFLAGVDWSSVNWKSLDNIARTAQREWRRFHPAPRKGAQALGKRFAAATGTIEERLQAEHARNLRALEQITATAEEHAAADTPASERIDAVKQLQQRWNAVGVTPRRQQQALWKRFRSACDSIFAARDGERDAERSARQASQDAAGALCQALQAHLDSVPPSQLKAAELADFEARFEALEEPVEEQHGRRRESRAAGRFADLVREFRTRLADQQRYQRLYNARALLTVAQQISSCETRVADGQPLADDALPAGLTGDAKRLFGARLQALASGNVAQVEAHASAELALEAEIIAGLESPEGDQELRMRVQVARLTRGLQGGVDDPQAVVINLIERWCLTAAPNATLTSRFERAIGNAIDDVAR